MRIAERSPVKIKPAAVKEIQKYDEARTGLKSASYAIPKPFEVIKARAQSADVYERKTTPTARLTKADKINEEVILGNITYCNVCDRARLINRSVMLAMSYYFYIVW